MFDKNIFGYRVRQIRQSIMLSLSDVARYIDTNGSSLGNIERGDKSPSIDMMIKIADCLCVSIDYLLGRSEDPCYEKYLDIAEKSIPFLPTEYKEQKHNFSVEVRLVILFYMKEYVKDAREFVDYWEGRETFQGESEIFHPHMFDDVINKLKSIPSYPHFREVYGEPNCYGYRKHLYEILKEFDFEAAGLTTYDEND